MVRQLKCQTLALLLTAVGVQQTVAQTGVGNEEVIVVKEYEAKIQDAQKINLNPNVPELNEKTPALNYTIPSREFKDFMFEANSMKPMAMSKEKFERYNSSFIKLGFGSQLTPLVQMAYNDNKAKNLQFGLFYNHLSSYGFKIKNQQFSDDEAGIYLKYNPKAVVFGTNFTFRNYRTHFYGYDHSDTCFSAKEIRQVFRDYNARIFIRNGQQNKAGINVLQDVRFDYYQERFDKSTEWLVSGNTDLDKSFLKFHKAFLHFDFDISQLKRDTSILKRNIFQAKLGYEFDNDDWEARGSFGFVADSKDILAIAEAYVEKRLYEHSIIAYAGYNLRFQKNSLRSLSNANRFIQNSIDVQNSQIGDVSVGLKGTLQNFTYNAAFHYNHISNFALFVNDSLDNKRFVVVYEKQANVINGHAELGYNAKEWLRFLVLADYNFYKLKHERRAWHQPDLRVTLRTNYIIKNKIVVSLDVFGITGAYAKLPDGGEKKLKGTADINLGLEYVFKKYLSFFGNLNNIGHFRYEQYMNYPSFGINGVVGLKFSF
jgi:hypothetical protein